jgi:hypothetical protein
MAGFIGMGAICTAVLLGERVWVWWVHRLEERASRDTSWAYTDFCDERSVSGSSRTSRGSGPSQ